MSEVITTPRKRNGKKKAPSTPDHTSSEHLLAESNAVSPTPRSRDRKKKAPPTPDHPPPEHLCAESNAVSPTPSSRDRKKKAPPTPDHPPPEHLLTSSNLAKAAANLRDLRRRPKKKKEAAWRLKGTGCGAVGTSLNIFLRILAVKFRACDPDSAKSEDRYRRCAAAVLIFVGSKNHGYVQTRKSGVELWTEEQNKVIMNAWSNVQSTAMMKRAARARKNVKLHTAIIFEPETCNSTWFCTTGGSPQAFFRAKAAILNRLHEVQSPKLVESVTDVFDAFAEGENCATKDIDGLLQVLSVFLKDEDDVHVLTSLRKKLDSELVAPGGLAADTSDSGVVPFLRAALRGFVAPPKSRAAAEAKGGLLQKFDAAASSGVSTGAYDVLVATAQVGITPQGNKFNCAGFPIVEKVNAGASSMVKVDHLLVSVNGLSLVGASNCLKAACKLIGTDRPVTLGFMPPFALKGDSDDEMGGAESIRSSESLIDLVSGGRTIEGDSFDSDVGVGFGNGSPTIEAAGALEGGAVGGFEGGNEDGGSSSELETDIFDDEDKAAEGSSSSSSSTMQHTPQQPATRGDVEMYASLIEPLRDDEVRAVLAAWEHEENDKTVVCALPSGIGGSIVDITGHHMSRMQAGWLIDETVNGFTYTLQKRAAGLCMENRNTKSNLFLNSFFFTKMFENNNEYSYQAVKRWCKNAPESNIFLLDKIIIPVNINNSHWCCFVAYMQRRHLQYYDSRDTGGQQHGTLEEGYKHINGFKAFLKDAASKYAPLSLDIDSWTSVATQENTPQQNNDDDCGVFACMFANYISRNLDLRFSFQNITTFRMKITHDILHCGVSP